MITTLVVLAALALVLLALLGWRYRKWRLVGRDRFTRLGRVKRIPMKRDPHHW